MKKLICILSIISILACSHTQNNAALEKESELKNNQMKWHINRLSFSNYTMKLNHFSPAIQDYSSIEITSSSDGHVYNYKVYDYEKKLPEYNLNYAEMITVDFLFDKITQGIPSQSKNMVVEYNDRYGYPEKVYLKYIDANEEKLEHTIHVTDFIPTK